MQTKLRFLVRPPARLLMMLILAGGCKSTAPEHTTTPPSFPTAVAVTEPEFVLGMGDEVAVFVWRRDDLKSAGKIDLNGNLVLPLAGAVPAMGLTPAELEQTLAERYRKFFVDPLVQVTVTDIRSLRAYVMGEVRSPGTLGLDRAINILDAINRSEGFTGNADTARVTLLRRQGDQLTIRLLNLNLSNPENGDVIMDGAQILRSGDIVYVPPQRISDFEKFMTRLNNILAPILGIERAILLGNDVADLFQGKSGERSSVIAF